MTEFLKKLITFCLIIIIITIIIECLLLTRMNLYSYKSSYVKTHADEIECLLLGNSHIEEALIPDSIGTGVFNLAISGRPLLYDVELAKMHIPKMHNLKILLVPLDYSLFSLGRTAQKKSVADKNLLSTIKCMHYKYMNLRVDSFWYWSEFLFSEENFMKRFFMTNEELIECDSLGFIPLQLSLKRPNWEQKRLPIEVDITKKKEPELLADINKQFTTLAEVTKSHQVRLILISTPTYKTYHEKMSEVLLEEMYSFIKRIQSQYPHISYYNYTYDNRFADDDFIDASHLSVIGASKFSRIVKEEIFEKSL